MVSHVILLTKRITKEKKKFRDDYHGTGNIYVFFVYYRERIQKPSAGPGHLLWGWRQLIL